MSVSPGLPSPVPWVMMVPVTRDEQGLGPSTIAITADVYAHVTPELRREAADALDRALGGDR